VDAVGEDMLPKIEYEEHAMAHLKTGYPGVFKAYQELGHIRNQIGEEEHKFIEDLKAKLQNQCPTVSSADDVARMVLDDTRRVLRGHKPSFLINLMVKGEEVQSNPFHLAPKEAFECLRDFIASEEKSEENTRKCMRMIELGNNYYASRLRFEKYAKDLILQVENRTPLNGRCDECSRVKLNQ
jgi:hypothetical protein